MLLNKHFELWFNFSKIPSVNCQKQIHNKVYDTLTCINNINIAGMRASIA